MIMITNTQHTEDFAIEIYTSLKFFVAYWRHKPGTHTHEKTSGDANGRRKVDFGDAFGVGAGAGGNKNGNGNGNGRSEVNLTRYSSSPEGDEETRVADGRYVDGSSGYLAAGTGIGAGIGGGVGIGGASASGYGDGGRNEDRFRNIGHENYDENYNDIDNDNENENEDGGRLGLGRRSRPSDETQFLQGGGYQATYQGGYHAR